MKGKAADCHMLVRMIMEIKVPRDRFRCVLVVFLYVAKVFSESVAKSSPCFVSLFRHSLHELSFLLKYSRSANIL